MQMHVPAGAKITMIVTEMDRDKQEVWDENLFLIKRLARIENVKSSDRFPKGCATLAVSGASLGLPLDDIINFDEERARLEKHLEKNSRELINLGKRIKNPNFLKSAPKEIVEEAKKNLLLREEENEKINNALRRLEALI